MLTGPRYTAAGSEPGPGLVPRKSPGRSRQGLGTPARDKGIWDGSPGVIGWADTCKGKMTTDQGSGRKMGSQGSPRLPGPAHLALPSYFHTPPHQRAPTTKAAAASCTELSPLQQRPATIRCPGKNAGAIALLPSLLVMLASGGTRCFHPLPSLTQVATLRALAPAGPAQGTLGPPHFPVPTP